MMHYGVDGGNHGDHDVNEHDDDEHDDGHDGQDAWDDIGEGARQWARLESCFKTGKLL